MDAAAIIDALGLVPHPEGGFYAETYRAAEAIPAGALPPRYAGARSLSTAIHYLLTADSFSAMHKVASDEVFHFYLGDPVELLILSPGDIGEERMLGTNLAAGQRPQIVVPRGSWQGLRLVPGGRFALLGATVAPGFDFADFELGSASALAAGWPAFAGRIRALTRGPARGV